VPSNRDDITELEAALDRTYLRHELPHPNRVLAIWYCLTASEDAQRILFVGAAAGADLPVASVIFYLDRYKYSMRYALDRIARETQDRNWAEVPRKVLPKLYEKATRLMFAGIDYALASQICAVLHTGTAALTKDADAWLVRLHETHHDVAYNAMEILNVARLRVPDFATILFHWIRNPSSAPELINRIARTTSRTREAIAYSYQPQGALALAQLLPQPPDLLPEAWKFPWGDKAQTTLLSNALALRCAYHMVAVHFGSGVHGIRGGGVSNIVLVLRRESLIADLQLMSSLNRTTTAAYIDSLTYGRGTQTPDPALQPVIALSSNVLALPCIHVMSSDQQRNLLSLMARTDNQAFDAQSHLFEEDMVAQLRSSTLPSGVQSRANFYVRLDGEEEELDFVLIDVAARRALICELRWMLGPGDPREVQNRKKEAFRKVEQVRRKVEWISARAERAAQSILDDAALDTQGKWLIAGIVLIAGYAGTRSPDSRYPIMPMPLFEHGLQKALSLESLVKWCEGLAWLPRENRHFEVKSVEMPLDGSIPVILEGVGARDKGADFLTDALATLNGD
jgi:hypothetical protein